jgi:hypothetical protein
VNAPAEFVVLRHLLSHPRDAPTEVARHAKLVESSVRLVLRRLKGEGLSSPGQWFEKLRSGRRRPEWRELRFQLPNPDNWYREFPGPLQISGEVAAAEYDRLSLIPSRHLVYIHVSDQERAIEAVWRAFGLLCPNRERANLVLRISDPWLQPDSDDPRFVERGQRLLDYAESRHIQLLGALKTNPGLGIVNIQR